MKKKCMLVGLVLCLMCSCLSQHPDWPMFMHDPQRRGFSTSHMPESLRLLWEFTPDSSIFRYEIVHFIVRQNQVIIPLAPSLYSLDISDGSLQWKIPMKLLFNSFPAAYGNRIYINEGFRTICLEATTGEVMWKYENDPPCESFLCPVNGRVYANTACIAFIDFCTPYELSRMEKRILCFHGETGEIIWKFYAHNPVSAQPVYHQDEDNILICDRTSLYWLDAATGELLQEKETPTGCNALALTEDGERIIIWGYGGTVTCFNSRTGEFLWDFHCSDSITAEMALGYNKVFFGCGNGVFCCVSDKKGILLWKTAIGPEFSPPVVADKKVAVGAGTTLYILDVDTGKILESYTVGSRIYTLALADGKLLLGEVDGTVTCLGSSSF